jgi:phosphomannomutase
MQFNLKELQNGSDIRGVAMEGVEGEQVNLTPEVIEQVAYAFACWLARKKDKPSYTLQISIGMDPRLSGPDIKSAVVKGLNLLGCIVADCGIISTPAMFLTTIMEDFEYDGAIMITASHLPFNRNGLKFFTNEGGLGKDDIAAILALAEKKEKDFGDQEIESKYVRMDFITVYSRTLVDKIRTEVNDPTDRLKPLKGYRIAVDAGNGVGGFFVDKVLKPLGADTTGSQFLEGDGTFPNHIPNPENPEAMDSLRKAVIQNKANIGVIFDTDVDRAAIVDGSGKEINRNCLIALMAVIVLEDHPGTTIVTDSITSEGLTWFIEKKLGGIHHRFKRGYRNVINEAIRLNKEGQECWLAIETSGHAAMKENRFLDDGAYIISKILIKLAQLKQKGIYSVGELIKDLPEPKESQEYRIKIYSDDFKSIGTQVIDELKTFAGNVSGWAIAANNYEGIRVSCDKNSGNGWFLTRLSLHDPELAINIESDSDGGLEIIVRELKEFFRNKTQLGYSVLER